LAEANKVQWAWVEYLAAFRNVVRQHRRTGFGIAAVTFGVLALVLATGFVEWIFWAARQATIQNGLGHIHVMRAGYLKEGHADPWNYLLPEDSPARESLVKSAGVRAVAPRLAFSGLISHGDTTLTFVGDGVDPEKEREVSRILTITAGENLSPDDSKGLLLGRGLAENLGVQVGSTVVLLTNAASGSINGVEGTVRGLFTSTVSKAYDDSALRAPLPLAQELIRVSGAHRWILVLDDTETVPQKTATLKAQVSDSSLDFVPWYEMADFYNKMVALLSNQIGVVQLIIGSIIVLSISNTMMISVMERTAEIGTSMALGRNRRQILWQFTYEGMTIGLLGGALGVGLGWALAMLISRVGIPMPPPPGMAEGYSGEILVNPRLLMNALILALGTTVLASLYPAWKASRMHIVDALRHNR
jgi:putative ABC transport system permease protein